MDSPQAVAESPRAEGDECPRAEGAESPRAEGAKGPRAERAEPAEAGDGGPQVCDTSQIRNGCLREEDVRRRKEEEKEEMKNVIPYRDGPIPKPPWIWRRMVSNRMRAWSWQWGRMWSWP